MAAEQTPKAHTQAPADSAYLEVSAKKDVLEWEEGKTKEVSQPSTSPHVLAPQHIGHVIWGSTLASTICLLTAAISIITRSNTTWYPWMIIGVGLLGAMAIPFAYMSKRFGARIAADGLEATSD